MTTKKDFENKIFEGLEYFGVDRYWVIYPKEDVVTEKELQFLRKQGYKLISINIMQHRLRVLLYKRKE